MYKSLYRQSLYRYLPNLPPKDLHYDLRILKKGGGVFLHLIGSLPRPASRKPKKTEGTFYFQGNNVCQNEYLVII